jgi:hypothetical protein
MAKSKPDPAAAKAKKQKMILIVGGVLLLGLGAIQGPKLLKSGSSAPAAAPAAATSTTAATTPVATPSLPATTGSAATGSGPSAVLAGVTLRAGGGSKASESQLVSFSLFQAKDPFVQQVGDGTGSASATGSTGPAGASTGATNGASAGTTTPPPSASGATTGTSGGAATPKPDPIKFATILFDGKSEQVQVKEQFPKSGPLFVLVGLKSKQAKIGVAGGTFRSGDTVTIAMGKTVTLVDTATGVRYELKLVYAGSAPEVIQSFSSGNAQATAPASGATAPSTGSTTGTGTTTGTTGTTTAAATP